MTTDREDWACQLSEPHHLPHSLNSLDDNSVDLEKSKQEIKARGGTSHCSEVLTGGPSRKGWAHSGMSVLQVLGYPVAWERDSVLAPLLFIPCEPGRAASPSCSALSPVNGDRRTSHAGLLRGCSGVGTKPPSTKQGLKYLVPLCLYVPYRKAVGWGWGGPRSGGDYNLAKESR